MHEECFLKSSDCCARCGKSLWERDTEEASTCPKKPTSESQAYNRRTGSFVRRTSVTDQGEVVHIRCSDKCKYCCEPICKYPSVKGKQLHKSVFLNYQKNIVGDVCKVCNGVLWEIDESSEGCFDGHLTPKLTVKFISRALGVQFVMANLMTEILKEKRMDMKMAV